MSDDLRKPTLCFLQNSKRQPHSIWIWVSHQMSLINVLSSYKINDGCPITHSAGCSASLSVVSFPLSTLGIPLTMLPRSDFSRPLQNPTFNLPQTKDVFTSTGRQEREAPLSDWWWAQNQRPLRQVWELAQLFKRQDSLGSIQGPPPLPPLKQEELFLLRAECFLSGSLSGEEKWLPMLGSSGG